MKEWRVPDDHQLVIVNLAPVPRDDYRLGVPAAGTYEVILASDDEIYGRSGCKRQKLVSAEPVDCGGWHESWKSRCRRCRRWCWLRSGEATVQGDPN